MAKYQIVKKKGFTFFFKFEDEPSDMLHIYSRHLTTITDALNTFFSSDPIWNVKRNRFETHSATHGLFWFWLDEASKKIMIVTCFKL